MVRSPHTSWFETTAAHSGGVVCASLRPQRAKTINDALDGV